ncbi:hypothetical protein KPH14_011568 [Odynerus spinipes]|uniref:Allatotropin n=1 Tax=Odynerus spinipes TaxID=1348599 RepID=A0AAD9RHC1_9HYME|nr:hypothetical protein KPH14_011568 [Odynerus spinipes]
MRFGLVIALILFGIVLMANGSRLRNYNTPNAKQSTKSRAIRGYKPEWGSMGIGFGKRDGSSEISNLNRQEKVLMSLLRNLPQGLSSEWILREMKTNPIFAGKLTEMIINDENGQTPIGEQVQPEGTILVY